MRPVFLLFPLPLFAFGCSSSSSTGTIQLITGGETDTFSRPPAPVTIRVDAADSTGNVATLATSSFPADTIDLGKQPQTTTGSLQVSALDADGKTLIFGASIPLQFGGLDGLTLPVFVQRTGELARLPAPLSDSRQAPTLGVIAGRYLFVGAGADPSLATTTQLYDFVAFSSLTTPPTLPRVPKSVAFVGTVGWLIDENGVTLFDLSSNAGADASLPAGGTPADIAGGATLTAADGTMYVVGATRSAGAPTAMVLAINPNDKSKPNGAPSWITLSAARLGAAAAWVDGRGLVVAGGSAAGAGVEIVGIGSTSGSGLPYTPDAAAGTGAAKLDAQHVLLAGGVTSTGGGASVRAIDLACASMCIPAQWGVLPVPLATAQTFAIDPTHALVVGNEASGATHAYRLTTTAATNLATKVAHTYASASWSPVGSVVLVGGAAEIESFTP